MSAYFVAGCPTCIAGGEHAVERMTLADRTAHAEASAAGAPSLTGEQREGIRRVLRNARAVEARRSA